MLCQDVEGLPVEVKVKSKGDGVYTCSYTPASSLKHTLAITWGGVSIPNSPFRVSSQSQLAGKTVRLILPKTKNSAEADGVKVVQSENKFKTEITEVVRSEQTQVTRHQSTIQSSKTKKPLIVVTIYTEVRFSS